MDCLNIGMSIRKIRKQKGLTAKQVGERCGKSEANFLGIERETRGTPTLKTIYEVSKALDCSVIEIINGALEENKSLNYEQLKEMTGKPIYHKELGMWFICQGVFENIYKQKFVTVNHDGCSTLFYEDDCYYRKEVKEDAH